MIEHPELGLFINLIALSKVASDGRIFEGKFAVVACFFVGKDTYTYVFQPMHEIGISLELKMQTIIMYFFVCQLRIIKPSF